MGILDVSKCSQGEVQQTRLPEKCFSSLLIFSNPGNAVGKKELGKVIEKMWYVGNKYHVLCFSGGTGVQPKKDEFYRIY